MGYSTITYNMRKMVRYILPKALECMWPMRLLPTISMNITSLKCILVCLFFSATISLVDAQHIVQLKNGRRIEADNIKINISGDMRITTRDGGVKVKLAKEDIDFFTIEGNPQFYLCPNDKECNFYPRIMNGRIEGFEEIFQGSSQQGTFTSYYFYARKEGVTKFIISKNTVFHDRSKGKNFLKDFFADDPDMLERVNSDEFKFNYENVLDVINDYNVRNFSKKQIVDTVRGNFIFYIKARKEPVSVVQLSVNDSIIHPLPYAKLVPIEVKGDPVKVCVENSCQLLTPGYRPVYIEIEFDRKSGNAKMSKVKAADAVRYIDFLKTR